MKLPNEKVVQIGYNVNNCNTGGQIFKAHFPNKSKR